MASKPTLRVAGLISGTSADGVSAAIADIGPGGVRLLASGTFPYPPSLRRRVFALFSPDTARVDEICHMNFVLGEVFASALLKLCARSRIPLDSVDLIGSHGQTIQHLPEGRRFGGRLVRSTLQIGEPSVIAERTGIITIADFRPRDIAAGGEGAPLVPYADYLLFRHPSKSRAIQNIGGIANVTFLPAGGEAKDVIAFDTGPGNMMIDRIAWRITDGKQHYDRNGRLAARGRVEESLLQKLMQHRFLRRPPPKSTGREEFGIAFTDRVYEEALRKGLSPTDVLATATALTARSIADAYRRFLPHFPEEVILCGGGARNRTLVEWIRAALAPAVVRAIEEFGLSAEAKEAVSFAILARETIRGAANNLPSATGASRPVVLGKIVLGRC